MSDAWNEGYFTDIGYTYGYYREINPTFQRYCLHLRGLAAPETGADTVHCELGFGQGVSIALHAAATPGSYIGTDFNPAQVAHAQGLARIAGNARLFDDSFEQLLGRDDLPQLDSISLHGIWSWISLENRRFIVEFARRRLKPGGVLYVSYNCGPGWSPHMPLRHLLASHDRHARSHATADARVGAALQFAEALLAAQPNYLKQAPALSERLQQIKTQSRPYLAHEYFNREWRCEYFTDVVNELSPAKFDYAATAMPLDAVNEANLTPEAIAFLEGIESPLLREQSRDYFVNAQFRKDLYLRGAVRLSAAEQQRRLLATRFVLLKPVAEVSFTVTTARGEIALQEVTYRPLVEALANDDYRPKTLHELTEALPEQGYPKLRLALAVLVGMAAVAPCQAEEAAQASRERCATLNTELCQRAETSPQVEWLASPLLGGGFAVNRFEQLFLLARSHGKKTPEAWAQQAWCILDGQRQKLIKEGRTLETAEENLAELTRLAAEFSAKRLSVLAALQIV